MSISSTSRKSFTWADSLKSQNQSFTTEDKLSAETALFKSSAIAAKTPSSFAPSKEQLKPLLTTMFSAAKKTDNFVQRSVPRETYKKMTIEEFRKTVYFSQKSVSCCINCDSVNKIEALLPLTQLIGVFNKSGFDPLKPPIDLVEMEKKGSFVALDNRRASAVYLAKDMKGDIPVRIYKRESNLLDHEIRRFSGKGDVRDGVIHLEKFQEGNKKGNPLTFQEAMMCRLSALNPEKIIKEPFFELPYAKPIISSDEHQKHADNYNKRLEKMCI